GPEGLKAADTDRDDVEADHGAPDVEPADRDGGGAEEGGGGRGQKIGATRRDVDGADEGGETETRQAGDRRAEDEREQPRANRANPGASRGGAVEAEEEEVASERGVLEDVPEDDREHPAEVDGDRELPHPVREGVDERAR